MKYLQYLKLSKLAVAFFSVISTFAVPLAFATPESTSSSTALSLLFGIAVSVLTAVCLLPLERLDLANGRRSIFLWFFFLALIGIGRGFGIHAGASLFGFQDPATLHIRLLNSAVTTIFWVSLFSILVESSRVFRIRYHDAIALALVRLSGLEAAHSRDVTILTSEARSMQGTVSVVLNEEGGGSLENLTSLQDEVERHINEVLRPLSHDIWRNAPLSAPRLRINTAIKLAITKLQYSYLAVIVPYSILGFINGLSIFGPAKSVLRLFIVGLAWTAIHSLFRKVMKSATIVNIIYLVISGLIPVYVSEYANYLLGNDYNYALATLAGFLMPLMIIAVSAFDLINRDREEILKFLEEVTSAELEDLKSYQAKRMQLAGYIHNSLQSELLAMAMQLAHAQSTHNYPLAKSTAERLQALLIRISNGGFDQLNQDPYERTEQIRLGWSGICEIEINLDLLSSLDEPKQVQIVQLCEEYVTNAVRIGNSTRISISGSKENHKYRIKFLSDGNLNTSPSSGLGDRWISTLTDGNWRIFQTSEGVEGCASISLR